MQISLFNYHKSNTAACKSRYIFYKQRKKISNFGYFKKMLWLPWWFKCSNKVVEIDLCTCTAATAIKYILTKKYKLIKIISV